MQAYDDANDGKAHLSILVNFGDARVSTHGWRVNEFPKCAVGFYASGSAGGVGGNGFPAAGGGGKQLKGCAAPDDHKAAHLKVLLLSCNPVWLSGKCRALVCICLDSLRRFVRATLCVVLQCILG